MLLINMLFYQLPSKLKDLLYVYVTFHDKSWTSTYNPCCGPLGVHLDHLGSLEDPGAVPSSLTAVLLYYT